MASSSSNQSSSSGGSESSSDTYIPDYSESPILREIATHARAMSDTVYAWGMDRFNRNQGDIDGLMRDALSYASPQRIAVDMGMAEAGVQQAGERGRLSAIRDLESYGIDPSSGRYAALDSANRVMTAAAAAGAGNQQRMADQAAGNAMRNQAIAAGLQNAQFGLGVGDSANKFLATGMQLKYPPLGRWSKSTSSQQSSSSGSSQTTDPPQRPPPEQKQPQEKGGQQPQQPKPPAPGKEPKPPPKKDEEPKPPPKKDKEPEDQKGPKGPGKEGPPKTGNSPGGGRKPSPGSKPDKGDKEDKEGEKLSDADKEELGPGTDADKEGFDKPELSPSDQEELGPDQRPELSESDKENLTPPETQDPNAPEGLTDSDQEPLVPGLSPADEDPLQEPAERAPTSEYNPEEGQPWQTAGGEDWQAPSEGYQPYENDPAVSGMDQEFDPFAAPVGDEQQEGTTDEAGSLYGTDEQGGWTGEGIDDYGDQGYEPTDYGDFGTEEDGMWGNTETFFDGTPDEAGGEQEPAYDPYETGAEEPGYDPYETEGVYDPGMEDAGGQELGGEEGYEDTGYGEEVGYGDFEDYGEEDYSDDYSYDEQDFGEGEYGDEYDYGEGQDYSDDYSYDEQDFGDEYDYGDQDYGDEYDYGDETDYGDDSEYDYGEDDYDYGEDDYDYGEDDYDYGDESDYGDDYDAYEDSGDYEEDYGGDYEDDSSDYEDDTDYGGDDEDYGARGGAVMRGRMKRGQRRARIMPPGARRPRRPMPTGYAPRPLRRRPRPAMAGGGQVPGPRGRMPPRPPGAMGMDRPPPRTNGAKAQMQPVQQAPRPARGAPLMAPGGPQPGPAPRGPMMPGNFISPNGMPPPTSGGMMTPQRMARGGQAGRRAEPTQGGFVSREMSPSRGSKTDDVNARLNAGEFVIPKDIAAWKGKEFFYKLIAQSRKARSGGDEKPQVGYRAGGGGQPPGRGMQR